MKVVGLITEYNPFHNGHKYHIEESKRLTGADYTVAVMSGNFVQRGTPAVIDKYSRAEMALRNGVDLVLELPVCYATGSAEYFAHGAVSLLSKLGLIDCLCFGSEAGNITLLQKAVQLIINSPDSFDDHLQSFLREGFTYPAARLRALKASIKLSNPSDGKILTEILTEPNNILGIEYLKAMHNLASKMQPITIQRETAHYHDIKLFDTTDSAAVSNPENSKIALTRSGISSATAIRKAIASKDKQIENYFGEIEYSVPSDVYQLLTEQHLITYPILQEDFSQIIKYKLLTETNHTLSKYMDISSDLAARMKNISDLNFNITELTDTIKTKNMTLTRINRALLHLLLNIRTEDLAEYIANDYTPYARVLGVRKEASHLLRKIEKVGRIPIITKVSRAAEQLDTLGLRMLSEDIFATHLYNQAVYEKYQTKIANEYKHGIVIL